MALGFRPAGPTDIPTLRGLAERIWRQSYAGLLAPAQINHMLAWMYGAETIAAEMARGVVWRIVEHDGIAVGYLSLTVRGGTAELHKLYLSPDMQSRGFGQAMLAEAQALARQAGALELRLRVNRHNARALKSYARAGFAKAGAVVSEIGGGFVMDDFVLARPLGPGATPLVKICGLSTPDTMEAAIAAGADQVGLVFFPRSPRHVTVDIATRLAAQARGRAEIVALTVDADDVLLDAIVSAVAPDWLQLHGHETPARAADLRHRSGRRVMKALGVAVAGDLAAALPYADAVDRLLFDAKPPAGARLPGGNGEAYDWTILRDGPTGFMMSGGLSPDNVARAIRTAGAAGVDVSSGVETAPGRKDVGKIAAFVATVRDLAATRA